MGQSSDIMRRSPSQARATTTIDTFFEATARILESGDGPRLTTNHIAARAGFSIGTFYGYFPDKHALLRAMALREAKRQEAHVLRALQLAGPDLGAEELVRIVIRSVLRPFEGRNRLRLAMMKLLARDADVLAAASALQNHVLDLLLREIAARTNGALMPLRAEARFTVLAAVSGAIQAAATERMDIFEAQAFEDEIVALVLSSLLRR
jgi:AcrR family transcriptional regulator